MEDFDFDYNGKEKFGEVVSHIKKVHSILNRVGVDITSLKRRMQMSPAASMLEEHARSKSADSSINQDNENGSDLIFRKDDKKTQKHQPRSKIPGPHVRSKSAGHFVSKIPRRSSLGSGEAPRIIGNRELPHSVIKPHPNRLQPIDKTVDEREIAMSDTEAIRNTDESKESTNRAGPKFMGRNGRPISHKKILQPPGQTSPQKTAPDSPNLHKTISSVSAPAVQIVTETPRTPKRKTRNRFLEARQSPFGLGREQIFLKREVSKESQQPACSYAVEKQKNPGISEKKNVNRQTDFSKEDPNNQEKRAEDAQRSDEGSSRTPTNSPRCTCGDSSLPETNNKELKQDSTKNFKDEPINKTKVQPRPRSSHEFCLENCIVSLPDKKNLKTLIFSPRTQQQQQPRLQKQQQPTAQQHQLRKTNLRSKSCDEKTKSKHSRLNSSPYDKSTSRCRSRVGRGESRKSTELPKKSQIPKLNWSNLSYQDHEIGSKSETETDPTASVSEIIRPNDAVFVPSGHGHEPKITQFSAPAAEHPQFEQNPDEKYQNNNPDQIRNIMFIPAKQHENSSNAITDTNSITHSPGSDAMLGYSEMNKHSRENKKEIREEKPHNESLGLEDQKEKLDDSGNIVITRGPLKSSTPLKRHVESLKNENNETEVGEIVGKANEDCSISENSGCEQKSPSLLRKLINEDEFSQEEMKATGQATANIYDEHLQRISCESENKWKEIEGKYSFSPNNSMSPWQWIHRNESEEVITGAKSSDELETFHSASSSLIQPQEQVLSPCHQPKATSVKKSIKKNDKSNREMFKKRQQSCSPNVQRLVDKFEKTKKVITSDGSLDMRIFFKSLMKKLTNQQAEDIASDLLSVENKKVTGHKEREKACSDVDISLKEDSSVPPSEDSTYSDHSFQSIASYLSEHQEKESIGCQTPTQSPTEIPQPRFCFDKVNPLRSQLVKQFIQKLNNSASSLSFAENNSKRTAPATKILTIHRKTADAMVQTIAPFQGGEISFESRSNINEHFSKFAVNVLYNILVLLSSSVILWLCFTESSIDEIFNRSEVYLNDIVSFTKVAGFESVH